MKKKYPTITRGIHLDKGKIIAESTEIEIKFGTRDTGIRCGNLSENDKRSQLMIQVNKFLQNRKRNG